MIAEVKPDWKFLLDLQKFQKCGFSSYSLAYFDEYLSAVTNLHLVTPPKLQKRQGSQSWNDK